MTRPLFIPILLIALLAIGGASAVSLKEATHIVAVDDKAPASDVVVAANFAASMKGTTGITYQSALASELRMLSFEKKTIVSVDGAHKMMIIYGNDDVAVTYFRNLGWRVEKGEGFISSGSGERDDSAPETVAADKNDDDAVVKKSETNDESVPVLIAESPHPSENEQPQPEPTAEPDEPAAPVAENDEKPSAIVRFWHWLKALF